MNKSIAIVFVTALLIVPLFSCGKSISASYCAVVKGITQDQAKNIMAHFVTSKSLSEDTSNPAHVVYRSAGNYMIVLWGLPDKLVVSLYKAESTKTNMSKIIREIEQTFNGYSIITCKESGIGNVFTTGKI